MSNAGLDFRALFEAVPGLYLVLTPDLRIVGATDAYLRATSTTRDAILGRNIFEVFPDNPDDPEATGVRNLRASLQRVLDTRGPDAMAVQKYDVRRPASEGGEFEERYWSPLNSPVLDAKGEVACIIHRVEEVTEFIRLKQSGSEREQRARALEDRVMQSEAEVYRRAQQLAQANRDLSAANSALANLYRQIAFLMERADDELSADTGETREDRGQSIAPEEMLARVGQLIAGHKRLEEQLRQSQKMEAVGRLAGGVAHDFNNLLTVIGGYAGMLRERQAAGVAAPELEEIERAVARAASMTHKLLAFSRKQILQPRIIDLNSVVIGVEELLRRLIGENVVLVTILNGKLGTIKADPNQIEQVIMNLVLNARDAMPEGGRLVIETDSIHFDEPFHSLPAGSYAVLTVSDTGHGMDSATAARIFEPFFTTKELGKGTGLGLSTVYGIVEQSGGTISVESAPGDGASFRVYLPVSQSVEDQPKPEPPAATPKAGTGSILLVEDEAPLRTLVSKILTAAGYRVVEAVNGEEALVLAQRQRFDLLLTDVVMPGMSGPDLMARLRATQAKTAVLFMSGYDHELIDHNMLKRTSSFIPKPFTPRALLAKVNEVMRGHRNNSASSSRAS